MSQQPEALRLADELDWRHQDMPICPERQAAAELRRLHAELEAMTQCAKNHDASRTKYLLLNAELLEALKWIDRRCDSGYFTDKHPPHQFHCEIAYDAGACARAAIARAEGEQK